LAHIQCAKVIAGLKFDVYNYLTNPANLAEQLQGQIEVKLQNPGVEVKQGSEFLFLMSRFGVEQPIRFVVDRLVIGNQFTYRQVNGVYARFVHTMRFEEHGQNETLVTDLVDYEMPFGILGRIADDFFVRSDLKRILEQRLEKTAEKFRHPEGSSAEAGSGAAADGELLTNA
jgi:ligand-binding SRPBCC domain-containing protein